MSGLSKSASAGVSIAYNAILIVAKLVAAIVTGSVAILSEVLNSSVDLVASVIAFVAVRRADEPADEEHPYGHEKIESVAAAIEGMLIIGGATYIVIESIGRLSRGDTEVESLGHRDRGDRVLGGQRDDGLGVSAPPGPPARLAGARRRRCAPRRRRHHVLRGARWRSASSS